MEEISLRELYYIFKKRLVLIIGLTVLGLALSAVVSLFVLKPEYETFTTLMVGKPKSYQTNTSGLDINDITLNQKLVHTYGELVKSRLVADEVIRNLNLDMAYEEFQNKVTVNLVNDTEIIKIQVRDRDPELAVQIANEVSDEFMGVVKSKMKVENIQIIDKAPLSRNPVSPRKMLNIAIGTVLGFMIGVFATFVLEYLDNTYKTPEDIEKGLHLPVLGAIPEITSRGRETIVRTNPKSPISEAFRTMRTNIQFTNIDKEMRLLAVTSSAPSEGKSTITSNLAISLSQEDKKVLLVDCDLRKPKMHKIFSVLNTQGLTSILMGANTIEDTVLRSPHIDGLSIITSGPVPPNPSELLNSKKMKEFLDRVKEDYDMVILDTPPIGPVTDSAVVSTLVDGTLLVIKAGETEIEKVDYAKELLDKVNANIVGAVLNNIPMKNGKGGYGYMEYYSYYGEDA